MLRDVVVLEQAATGVLQDHHSGDSIIQMAASHDTHAPACRHRLPGCAEGEAQSEGNVRCIEEPSTSEITPHALLALLRRAHFRQVICWTLTSALYPNAGRL